MQITDQELNEFIDLYEREFGKSLKRGAAMEMAVRLITLVQLILRPLPREVEDEIRRRSEAPLHCGTAPQDV